MISACRKGIIALTLGGILASPAGHGREFDADKISNTFFGQAYLTYQQGDPFQSMAMLMAADKQARLGDDQALGQLFLADNFTKLGLYDAAIEIYSRLAANPESSQSIRDNAWLQRAKLQLEQGRFQAALASLENIEQTLTTPQEVERDSVTARALLQLGETDRAITALPEIDDDTSVWTLYQLFNIGVDLIEAHGNKNGAVLLHRISRLKPNAADNEIEAVRDQANLALGYSLLKLNKPAKARKYLEKVRLKSHLSDIALLGMGWSYSSEQNYEQALVFWLELHDRPYRSAYGYETMLAIPYALSKAGAYNQAIKHYQAAQKQIDADTHAMNEAKKKINSELFPGLISAIPGEETGWLNQWQHDPAAPEQRFLPLLLDNPHFQAALREYRALLKLKSQQALLKTRIDSLKQQPAASADERDMARLRLKYQTITQQTEAARQEQLTKLKQHALKTLNRYQGQLNSYRDQIKFGMAQAIEGGTFGLEEGL